MRNSLHPIFVTLKKTYSQRTIIYQGILTRARYTYLNVDTDAGAIFLKLLVKYFNFNRMVHVAIIFNKFINH